MKAKILYYACLQRRIDFNKLHIRLEVAGETKYE